jgi:hypothetical protein
MRRYFLVMLLLVVTVLLSGQQGCQTGGGDSVGEGPYVGGNDGLSIAFLDDAPPLGGNFQGDPIPVEVELTNNGETQIDSSAAVVRLMGTAVSKAFKLSKSGSSSNVGIIERINDPGDIPDSDFVDLGSITLQDSEKIGPSWSPNIRAQVCYPYETNVQIDDLCIPGSRNEIGTVECEVDNSENLIGKGDVSAGPIQVTNLVESRTGEGIRVRMDIENQGSGDVVTVPCTTNTINVPTGSKNIVTVEVPNNYECIFKDGTKSVGNVELRNGLGRLRCTSKLSGNTGRSYYDRFTATLTYNYVEEIGRTVLIQSRTNF